MLTRTVSVACGVFGVYSYSDPNTHTFCLTVKNLSGSIPSLLEKIQELNSQLSSANNVSEKINKIKELIEEAREAANRVRHVLIHTN